MSQLTRRFIDTSDLIGTGLVVDSEGRITATAVAEQPWSLSGPDIYFLDGVVSIGAIPSGDILCQLTEYDAIGTGITDVLEVNLKFNTPPFAGAGQTVVFKVGETTLEGKHRIGILRDLTDSSKYNFHVLSYVPSLWAKSLTITPEGNVGIGTDNITGKLQIKGSCANLATSYSLVLEANSGIGIASIAGGSGVTFAIGGGGNYHEITKIRAFRDAADNKGGFSFECFGSGGWFSRLVLYSEEITSIIGLNSSTVYMVAPAGDSILKLLAGVGNNEIDLVSGESYSNTLKFSYGAGITGRNASFVFKKEFSEPILLLESDTITNLEFNRKGMVVKERWQNATSRARFDLYGDYRLSGADDNTDFYYFQQKRLSYIPHTPDTLIKRMECNKLNIYSIGFIRVWLFGCSETSNVLGARFGEWTFHISNADPVITAVTDTILYGTPPTIRVTGVATDIRIEVDHNFDGELWSGSSYLEIFAPNGKGVLAGGRFELFDT